MEEQLTEAPLSANQCEGFSERLNRLLDDADYKPAERGRARQLAEMHGVSKSGARKWITLDTPPRINKLREVVSTAIGGIERPLNESKVCAWLLHGEEANNPFSTGETLAESGLDHIQLSKVYLAVAQVAKDQSIQLESLENDKLDHIYQPLFSQLQRNPEADLDTSLIKHMLLLAAEQR